MPHGPQPPLNPRPFISGVLLSPLATVWEPGPGASAPV